MRGRPLLLALSFLVAADCVLTYIAVGHLGATEVNPLCEMCGGLQAFMVMKIAVSAAVLGGLAWFGRAMPRADAAITGIGCVLYAGALVWNAGALLHA